MRKKKFSNLIIILIFIVLIVVLELVSYSAYWYYNPLEEQEISMLQYNFKVESDFFRVVLENDDIENTVEEEELPKEKDNTPSTNKNEVASSTKTKTQTSTKTSSGGSSPAVNVTPKVYTPKINIPRTKVNLTIYSNYATMASDMEKGVSILDTENGLNQPGNTVISGHNRSNGRLFSNNAKINEGDLIYITDSTGTKITYSVYSKYTADPTDANYMMRDTEGRREISLTTCTPDSSQRIIILAREV